MSSSALRPQGDAQLPLMTVEATSTAFTAGTGRPTLPTTLVTPGICMPVEAPVKWPRRVFRFPRGSLPV